MEPDKPNSSTEGNVASLHGAQIGGPKPNAGWIATLREALEQAEAGETTGGVIAKLHHDNTASYAINGMIGPYSLKGAVGMAETELTNKMIAALDGRLP